MQNDIEKAFHHSDEINYFAQFSVGCSSLGQLYVWLFVPRAVICLVVRPSGSYMFGCSSLGQLYVWLFVPRAVICPD